MLSFSVPPGYRRTAPIKRPKLDGFTEIIDQWLRDDVGQHRKQRHTAKRVFDRRSARLKPSGNRVLINRPTFMTGYPLARGAACHVERTTTLRIHSSRSTKIKRSLMGSNGCSSVIGSLLPICRRGTPQSAIFGTL
jgi:hypothetical protein